METPPGPQPASPLWEWAPRRRGLGGPQTDSARLTVRPRQACTREGEAGDLWEPGAPREAGSREGPMAHRARGRRGCPGMGGSSRDRGYYCPATAEPAWPVQGPAPRRGPTGCPLRVPAPLGGCSHAVPPDRPHSVSAPHHRPSHARPAESAKPPTAQTGSLCVWAHTRRPASHTRARTPAVRAWSTAQVPVGADRTPWGHGKVTRAGGCGDPGGPLCRACAPCVRPGRPLPLRGPGAGRLGSSRAASGQGTGDPSPASPHREIHFS